MGEKNYKNVKLFRCDARRELLFHKFTWNLWDCFLFFLRHVNSLGQCECEKEQQRFCELYERLTGQPRQILLFSYLMSSLYPLHLSLPGTTYFSSCPQVFLSFVNKPL